MKIVVHAVSSSGGSYPVEFSDVAGSLRVFCHCQAGVLQQMCKHKLALLKGDRKMLFDPADEPLLLQVLTTRAYAEVKARLAQFEGELSSVEREIAKLKEQEKAIKNGFAYELTFGRRKNQLDG